MRGGVIVTALVLGVACARVMKPWNRPTPGRGPEVPMRLPAARQFCGEVYLLTLEEIARGSRRR